MNTTQQERTSSPLPSLGGDLRQLHVSRKRREILPRWKKKNYIYKERSRSLKATRNFGMNRRCCLSLLLYNKEMEEINLFSKIKCFMPIFGNFYYA